MQFSGHVIVNEEKITVLVRTSAYYVSLKLKTSGKDGHFLEDESIYLSEPDSAKVVELLKSGKVIKC